MHVIMSALQASICQTPPEPVELEGLLEYKVEGIRTHRKWGRKWEILV